MPNAIVLTAFGGPEVLQWRAVTPPEPEAGEVLVRVRAAAVGPTDLHIREGALTSVFPQRPGDVLGFEAAGVVEAVGAGATARVGDEVAALLPAQGGYGEFVTTAVWHPKPRSVPWEDAAALPAAADAALGTLRRVRAAGGEILVVLGAVGSVGAVVTQLARSRGVRVIGVARPQHADAVRALGAEFVESGAGLFDRIGAHVDAVIDTAGRGGLTDAVAATGDAGRVVTLVGGPEVASSGAFLSHPAPDRAPDALAETMPLLASGALRLKRSRTLPIGQAAEAHRLLESGEVHDKIVLAFP